MRYKPTKKFATLSRFGHNQGLDREDYDAFQDGKTVELKSPPERLVKDGYIEKAVKPASKKGMN